MKKLIFLMIIALCLVSIPSIFATAMTNDISVKPTAYWWTGNASSDKAWAWAKEVQGLLDGTFTFDNYLEFSEISAPSASPAANKGWLYIIDSDDTTTLVFKDSAGTITNLLTGGGVSISSLEDLDFDDIYNQSVSSNAQITVDQEAITLTVPSAGNNRGLDIVQHDTTNNPEAVRLTNTGSGDTLQFISTGGKDIDGSGSTWYVTSAGAGTFASLSATTFTFGATGVVLSNGETITNATDTEIKFTDAAEDFSIDFVSNELDLKSGSGVEAINFADLDNLLGLNNLTFDASASVITLPSNSTGDDLTISLTGSTDSSLVLSSTGTEADAIQITAANGGIDITNGGAVAGEDIDISSSGTSVHITGAEAIADAVTLLASAGGIDFTSAATFDIDILATGGKVLITGNENAAGAVTLATTSGGGASETILLSNDSGTGTDAIDIDSTLGGIDLDATKSITLTSVENEVDAIKINATVGGIQIYADAGIATEDIEITAATSSVIIQGGEADAAAVRLRTSNAAGGIDIDYGTGDMVITGAGVAADFTLDTDVGSLDFTGATNISVTGSTNEDLTISQLGSADASVIVSSVGTGVDAIALQSTTGGLDIDAKDDMILTLVSTINGDDLKLTQTGNAGTIILTAAGNETDAIKLSATAGGVDIDGANDVTINVASATTGDNLALVQTGAFAAGITLAAAGTGDDAIDLNASAGGIDIDSVKSVTIESTENSSDAIVISTTLGGIDITNGGQAGDTEDLNITSSAASIIIWAEEADAGAITIDANNDAGGINVDCGTGGFDLLATNGAFSIDGQGVSSNISLASTGAQDLTISTTGAFSNHLILSSTGTSDDAIQLTTTAGGIELTNGGAAGATNDILLTSTSASISLVAGEAVADAIKLNASNVAGGIDVDFGTSDMIIVGTGVSADFSLDCDLFSLDGTGASNVSVAGAIGEDFTVAQTGAADSSLILSSTGTGADALQINTSAGGIDITVANGGAGEDIDLTTNTSINLTANEVAADQIKLSAVGAIEGAAIDLVTTNGGITLAAVGGTNGDVVITAGDDFTLTVTGAGSIDTGDWDISATGDMTGIGGITMGGSLTRTSQQYVQSIANCKVGATAGWVVGAADNLSLATCPVNKTASTLVVPITIPLKVGYTITGYTINGQIESDGNSVTLDADLRKHTEATAGYADASVDGSGAMSQLAKTADYKIVDGKSSITEVVAADESYYLLITATTAAVGVDIEIAGITVTVSEI